MATKPKQTKPDTDRKAKTEAAVSDTNRGKAVAAGLADGASPENCRVPEHPVEPNPMGSSTEPADMPTGPQGEDFPVRTSDIAPDGTPETSKGFVRPSPKIDGYSERELEISDSHTDVDQAAPDHEDVAYTPWGRDLHELKNLRRTRFEDPGKDDPKIAMPLSE